MITYSKDTKISNDTKKLIDFFNKLEKELEYPNCEGNADKERILLKAERELRMGGVNFSNCQ